MERGDHLGTDPLTYPGVKSSAKLWGIQLLPIQQQHLEMSEAGIRYAIQNEHIKGLYVIPDYHNPTTHIMSVATRKMIAQLAKEYDLLVIEDGINTPLTENILPPIAAYAPEQVVYLSSLSKAISPGLRTAFVHVPSRHHKALMTVLYTMNISLSPLLASAAAEVIWNNADQAIIAERKQELIQRNQLVNEYLKGYVKDTELTCPMRFVSLPPRYSGIAFEQAALEQGVEVYGAERFSVGNEVYKKCFRISVVTPATIELLKEGLRRLQLILNQAFD